VLNFSQMKLERDPYVFGVAPAVLDQKQYVELSESYPSESLFAKMGGVGYDKLSLSERNNPEAYKKFIAESPQWSRFHAYIKSVDFRRDVFRAIGSAPVGIYTSRFEFSSMPAFGGFIAPHTDIPSKIVTLVMPMIQPGEWWERSWGGGTDILRPKDARKKLVDYQAPIEEFEVVRSVPYSPNQALVFIKSKDSWHSSGPYRGVSGKWRRTLTINIERAA